MSALLMFIKCASQTNIHNSQVCHTCQHATVCTNCDNDARNPAGVAVQWVKWYQCMTVRWQLKDSHHIQIFKMVPLDSYIIFDVWSAVLQPQVIPYSGLQYFSTLSLNRHDFLKKHFFGNKMCVLISSKSFSKTFYYKKSRARINKKFKEPFFLSDFRSTWIFLTFSKKPQISNLNENPCSGRRVPCGLTDRHDEANSCFSQFCESA